EPPINHANEYQTVRVQATKTLDLLLRGQHLWRNPRVFLGGQPADTVEVLPGMNGLSVRFNSVGMPPQKGKDVQLVDVSVVTSEGASTLRNMVQIVPDTAVPEGKLAVTLESPLAINVASDRAAPLNVSIPTDMVPDGFYRMALSVRPLLPGEDPTKVTTRPFYPLSSDVRLVSQGKKMIFQLPFHLPGYDDWRQAWRSSLGGTVDVALDGLLMEGQISMAATPGAALTPVPTSNGKPIVFAYFPRKSATYGALWITGQSLPKSGSIP